MGGRGVLVAGAIVGVRVGVGVRVRVGEGVGAVPVPINGVAVIGTPPVGTNVDGINVGVILGRASPEQDAKTNINIRANSGFFIYYWSPARLTALPEQIDLRER